MLEFLEKTMVAQNTIDQSDVDRFIVSDSPKDIAAMLSNVVMNTFGLKHGVIKPRWWLLESALPKAFSRQTATS